MHVAHAVEFSEIAVSERELIAYLFFAAASEAAGRMVSEFETLINN
jgi:hypothetical protein